jgi:hypothetical protein
VIQPTTPATLGAGWAGLAGSTLSQKHHQRKIGVPGWGILARQHLSYNQQTPKSRAVGFFFYRSYILYSLWFLLLLCSGGSSCVFLMNGPFTDVVPHWLNDEMLLFL